LPIKQISYNGNCDQLVIAKLEPESVNTFRF
jgi:hypothetical protein